VVVADLVGLAVETSCCEIRNNRFLIQLSLREDRAEVTRHVGFVDLVEADHRALGMPQGAPLEAILDPAPADVIGGIIGLVVAHGVGFARRGGDANAAGEEVVHEALLEEAEHGQRFQLLTEAFSMARRFFR
jgi:hypothetical protein